MYKVFYYDKLIILAGKDEKVFPAESDLVVDYQKHRDFEDTVEWFLYSKKPSRIIFHSKNLKTLKIHFFSLFMNVSAAGGLVSNSNHELLSIKRFGVWDLPKGKVEKGEKKKEAAMREVKEETGIVAEIPEKKSLRTYHIYSRGKNVVLKTTFWYPMNSEQNAEGIPQKEEMIEEVRWIPQNALPDYFSSSYRSLQDLLNRYYNQKLF